MPAEDDLARLYTGYYTHQSPSRSHPSNRFRVLLEKAGAAYLHQNYGYKTLSQSRMSKLMGLAVYLHPAWKNNLDSSVFHLDANEGGHLLEIGCGSGDALQFMRKMGWRTTGLDFDEGAVRNARCKGLDVRQGQLSDQSFADKSFDAVVMSHVIEHVPSPALLLGECLRVLKKSGTLVALTPNANSPAHIRYGRNWRGVETPRHLQIFTPKSLYKLVNSIGFGEIVVFTTMNGFVYQDLASKQLEAGQKHIMGGHVALVPRILSHIKAFYLGWLRTFLRNHEGEEIVLVCRK
jgi:ubiquinone/menaquinone biosynthesis C-methylase UbiE